MKGIASNKINRHTDIKNTRCATRIHNKVSETFSDRKFYLKHKLSTASLQSSTVTLPVEDCRLAVESLCFK